MQKVTFLQAHRQQGGAGTLHPARKLDCLRLRLEQPNLDADRHGHGGCHRGYDGLHKLPISSVEQIRAIVSLLSSFLRAAQIDVNGVEAVQGRVAVVFNLFGSGGHRLWAVATDLDDKGAVFCTRVEHASQVIVIFDNSVRKKHLTARDRNMSGQDGIDTDSLSSAACKSPGLSAVFRLRMNTNTCMNDPFTHAHEHVHA